MSLKFEDYQRCADYVKGRLPALPEIAVILGSCLGDFSERIQNPVVIDYKEIPGFLVTTVKSHAGKLIYGTLCGKKIICMSGRFHFYEGYSFEQLTLPIRLFHLLGVKATILTNASGAVNTGYRPGDVMIIKDHIKLTCESPLGGENINQFGPRFFDVTRMYTPELRRLAVDCAENTPLRVHEGVYMYFTGPQFETPAEIRAARILGADAIGMSTVTESLTAAHCSMPLLALAVITNMAAGIDPEGVCHGEMAKITEIIRKPFGDYVENIIKEMPI